MEKRTLSQLPIGNMDAMRRWYKQHALFCIENNMICFEMAYYDNTGHFPAFMLHDYTRTETRAKI